MPPVSPTNKLRLIPSLEKARAGLGAAGMAAVAVQTIGLFTFGGAEVLINLFTLMAAVVSAVSAWRLTHVSEKEVKLELDVGRESTLSDDATQ